MRDSIRAFTRILSTLPAAGTLLFLAACQASAGLPASNVLPLQPRSVTSVNYKTLYVFKGYSHGDGQWPQGRLIKIDSVFYGTTSQGGRYQGGTVFKIAAGGTESVVYSFGGSSTDGLDPGGNFVESGGILYGTTFSGGSFGQGTIFSITPSGKEKILHNFSVNGPEGFSPVAGLVRVNGVFYGLTSSGGKYGGGTAFAITASGTLTTLHNFGGKGDGSIPAARFTVVGGALYGTTEVGGQYSLGTVFSMTTSGTEKVIYSFGAGNDGESPIADLLNFHGKLYGTTLTGGKSNCLSHAYQCGTVFSVTTSGVETVLYRFAGGSDGASPYAGLTELNGTLYGTTYAGGGTGCQGSHGCGVVYSVTTSGVEAVLYSYQSGANGGLPEGVLLNAGGTLYGTTYGAGSDADGTVFSIVP